uniref:HD domain-containing protein n=1 Tax=Tetraselmis sp. GSL018 TaxID=582737 RepID=A0A061S453_9CHLO
MVSLPSPKMTKIEYSTSLAISGSKWDEIAGSSVELTPELCVVQDADRLDAMGAIGIARCFTFGGRFCRTLHDPSVLPRRSLTKEAYTSGSAGQTTINHFHEKLLRLKGMMKTEAGRELAASRHRFLEEFLERFHAEWDGAA